MKYREIRIAGNVSDKKKYESVTLQHQSYSYFEFPTNFRIQFRNSDGRFSSRQAIKPYFDDMIWQKLSF